MEKREIKLGFCEKLLMKLSVMLFNLSTIISDSIFRKYGYITKYTHATFEKDGTVILDNEEESA